MLGHRAVTFHGLVVPAAHSPQGVNPRKTLLNLLLLCAYLTKKTKILSKHLYPVSVKFLLSCLSRNTRKLFLAQAGSVWAQMHHSLWVLLSTQKCWFLMGGGVCCNAGGSGVPILGWEQTQGTENCRTGVSGPCRCVTASCEQHPVFHLKVETEDLGFIWTDSSGKSSIQIIIATAVCQPWIQALGVTDLHEYSLKGLSAG